MVYVQPNFKKRSIGTPERLNFEVAMFPLMRNEWTICSRFWMEDFDVHLNGCGPK